MNSCIHTYIRSHIHTHTHTELHRPRESHPKGGKSIRTTLRNVPKTISRIATCRIYLDIVCMHACMYIYVCISICIWAEVYECTYICIYTCIYEYSLHVFKTGTQYMYECMYECMYTYMFMNSIQAPMYL